MQFSMISHSFLAIMMAAMRIPVGFSRLLASSNGPSASHAFRAILLLMRAFLFLKRLINSASDLAIPLLRNFANLTCNLFVIIILK